MVETLKQAGMTRLQCGVEDVREHWSQLVSAVLQGGWRDRVWTGCFAGVLSLEELEWFSSSGVGK